MNSNPVQGEVINVGQFEVTSGVLEVTDPCYSPGTDAILKNVRVGKWNVFTEIVEGRNASLTIYHNEYKQGWLDGFTCESNDIGVDSGQAGFFDAEFYIGGDDQKFYDQVCDLTLNGDNAGVIAFGAVSSSGWGDGCYELQTIRHDGEVVAARIVFMEDTPAEDEYNEEDDEDNEEEEEVTEDDSENITSSVKKSRYAM